MQLYTVAQMQAAERRAEAEFGIPLAQLMSNAGKALACAALEMHPEPKGTIGIFCGSGNNGGDGYVCGAELLRRGREVMLWAIGADRLPQGSLAANAAEEFLAKGGTILPVSPALTAEDIPCGLLIDALLGTGLTRPVTGLYAYAIELINSAAVPVLACDLPSGVNGDTGEIMGAAVMAEQTLMMGLGKLACALPPGSTCFGRYVVCEIGLPASGLRHCASPSPMR